MAVALTQVITEDRASGAQVIDGSLKFVSGNSTHLTRTPGSAGNRRTWTWSAWFKRTDVSASTGNFTLFAAQQPSGSDQDGLIVDADGSFYILFYSSDPGGGNLFYYRSDMQLRDPSAWYHVLFVLDTTQSTVDDRCNVYINGERVVDVNTSNRSTLSQNFEAAINNTGSHTMGKSAHTSDPGDGHLSQVYFIDGYALSPTDFGFTDGLTNTWRPKKYTGTYGTNGFYLPMDGNSSIGEDKSGNGNNWTPINFNGSNTLEKATGALPILNTINGGRISVNGHLGSRVSEDYTVSASSGGGNPYIFDTAGTQPTFNFIRGASYTFDYSNATSHPLRFSTTSNGTHGGGSEYTDGTNTSGNVHTITVPHDAPDTLYYYCTAHSGMGNSISVTTDEKKADLYASSLVFAMPLAGDHVDLSAQINPGSGNAKHSANKNGNAQSTFSQYNFYERSFDFDGSGDYVKHDLTDGTFLMQGNTFTAEAWCRADTLSSGGKTIFSVGNGTASNTNYVWQVIMNGATQSFYGAFYNGTTQRKTQDADNTVAPGKWYHVAYQREGSLQELYVNGRLVATTTHTETPNNNTSSSDLTIGASFGGSDAFDGQIQDARIYVGIRKYTSNFTIGATDPDIVPDTPSGVAFESKLEDTTDITYTDGGAIVCDGSGDFLSIADHADLDLGSDDWTFEGWFYFRATSSTGSSFFSKWGTARSYNFVWHNADQNYKFAWSTDGSNETVISSATFDREAETNRWVHMMVVRGSDRIKVFRDGEEIINNNNIGSSTIANTSENFCIGRMISNTNYDLDGYVSNFRFVKGTALQNGGFRPSTKPLTNITNTKLLCCQSQTSATAAAVTPGTITANGNVTTTSKFSPWSPDDSINTVRGQESGWATLNPLQTTAVHTSDANLTNGNLDISFTASANNYSSYLTQSIESGKYYFEVTINSSTTSSSTIGFVGDNNVEAKRNATASAVPGLQGTYGRGVDGSGIKYNGSGSGEGQYMKPWQQGDVIMVAIDADNDRFYLGKNGRLETTEITFPAGTTKPYHFGVGDSSGSVAASFSLNTGQKPFKYAPPEGYNTLCLANLPRPTEAAVRPDKYFKTVLYTGNNGTQTITGLGFDPGLVWIKNRTSGNNNMLFDVIRGTDNAIISNTTAAEGASVDGTLSAFGSDGFTVYWDGQAGTGGNTNQSSNNYVAWCWKAGGAAVSNTDGSITTQVSASPESGFSIIGYTGNTTTGASIGHGLNQAPEMLIFKSLNETRNWLIWHKDINAGRGDYYLQFNALKRAFDSRTDRPLKDTGCTTDTTIILGLDNEVNNNDEMICYAFHSVSGFSKIGEYDGNGNADGPYVHCGFRPAFIILKNYAGGSETDWIIEDSARDTYNPVDNILRPNTDQAEATGSSNYYVDFLSNGFKLRTSSAAWNENNSSYLFMAFAEAPTNNLYGGQANAR